MTPEEYMREAIAMAKRAPEVPYGTVIVDTTSGAIVARGVNRHAENPILHGEIDAINRCAAEYPGINWSELALYTTAEPCAMCQSAVEWLGIEQVYYGSSIPFLESQGLRQIDIRAEEVARRTAFRATRIIGGVLELECNALFVAAAQRQAQQ